MFAVGTQVADFKEGYSDDLLQASLLKMLGPQRKKLEEVDMAEAMKRAGLYELFEVGQWPSSAAVRELATQLKTKRFVCCDLRK